MISVVIRTKNEADWIGRCLQAVKLQQVDCGLEVIVVDNQSTDRTCAIARAFEAETVNISDAEFGYGRALNIGIAAAKGEFIAILSGHCVPVHDRWLTRLTAPFYSSDVAGVYGRQEPLPDSSDFDKRDLWTTFGLDRRIQERDWFFHNANSMVRRSVWEKMPFSELINGVEDRDWAKRVQECGHRIMYEPRASVFHHHGIHQGRDELRAERVARVIELINNGSI